MVVRKTMSNLEIYNTATSLSELFTEMVQTSPDKIEEANRELNDLFSLEQEVAVNVIELDWFNEINMTPQQVNAITFMIKDEE